MYWDKRATKLCKKCPLHLKCVLAVALPWKIWGDRFNRQHSYMYYLYVKSMESRQVEQLVQPLMVALPRVLRAYPGLPRLFYSGLAPGAPDPGYLGTQGYKTIWMSRRSSSSTFTSYSVLYHVDCCFGTRTLLHSGWSTSIHIIRCATIFMLWLWDDVSLMSWTLIRLSSESEYSDCFLGHCIL